MVRLSDILEKINEIETKTLRKATHICISRVTAENITNQYKEICESNADLIYAEEYNKVELEDVGDFLGVRILIAPMTSYEFKVLEEITPYS